MSDNKDISQDAGNLPYISAHLPGIGGRLKENPDFFVVEEIPLYLPQGQGPHLYLHIRRSGMGTRQLVEELAAVYGVKASEIGYAGLKDKWALTSQMISLPLDMGEEETRRLSEGCPWEILSVSRHQNKLKVGHLIGNRFSITLTEVQGSLQEAQAIASFLKENGAPNFFGEQRFGNDGDNMMLGLEFLKSGRKAKSWRDKFLLSSLQSFVYNHYLAKRLDEGLFYTIVKGDICKKHQTGGIFISEDENAEKQRFLAKELSHTGPLFGAKMMKPQHQAARLEEEVLQSLQLSEQEMAKTGSGDRRVNRLLLPDLSIEQNDLGLNFSFALPKGSYATTIMREFIK